MILNHLDFLPAVLEIQEKPPLAAGRYIIWFIMLFFTVALVWACVGQVDIVSVASGKFVPGSRVKIIQPLETAVVQHIHVSEGQHVRQGDALIQLDSTIKHAGLAHIRTLIDSLEQDRYRLKILIEKLQGRQDGTREITTGSESMHGVAGLISAGTEIHLQHRINSEFGEYLSRRHALHEEQRQRQAERDATVQRIELLDQTIPLITERSSALSGLLEKDMVSRSNWLELEETRIQQVKQRDVRSRQLLSLNAAVANVEQRISGLKLEYESRWLAELAETEKRLSALEQERIKTDQKIKSGALTAPVDGKVHQLAIHTIGAVVTPGQELLRIVPENDPIEIEAWLQNRDIGFVYEGQPTVIKVETFPFTKYGTINGVIRSVSDDALLDDRLGLVYPIRVEPESSSMEVNGKSVNMTPGMAASIELNLGKRRLIEFLLAPLLKYKDESLRER
ncbi:MAG: HlyD family type I secretion periplasmic adaptor subunit [Thiotrichales bacterium]|nr:HlyD family type I secretion periplasmic adaptor subunit [Thiotrichales bacterium]